MTIKDTVERLKAIADPPDRSKVELTNGEKVTPYHRDIDPATGMQKAYVTLSAEERAKGWQRPYRDSYVHLECGARTVMSRPIAETYARDPTFYSGPFCTACRQHFPLEQFVWDGTNEQVGS